VASSFAEWVCRVTKERKAGPSRWLANNALQQTAAGRRCAAVGGRRPARYGVAGVGGGRRAGRGCLHGRPQLSADPLASPASWCCRRRPGLLIPFLSRGVFASTAQRFPVASESLSAVGWGAMASGVRSGRVFFRGIERRDLVLGEGRRRRGEVGRAFATALMAALERSRSTRGPAAWGLCGGAAGAGSGRRGPRGGHLVTKESKAGPSRRLANPPLQLTGRRLVARPRLAWPPAAGWVVDAPASGGRHSRGTRAAGS
jgi:hypothetical protein